MGEGVNFLLYLNGSSKVAIVHLSYFSNTMWGSTNVGKFYDVRRARERM